MCGDHRGEQVQSTGLKHACGLRQYMLPVPDPVAVRLYPNLLSDSPILEWIFKLLPICFGNNFKTYYCHRLCL